MDAVCVGGYCSPTDCFKRATVVLPRAPIVMGTIQIQSTIITTWTAALVYSRFKSFTVKSYVFYFRSINILCCELIVIRLIDLIDPIVCYCFI